MSRTQPPPADTTRPHRDLRLLADRIADIDMLAGTTWAQLSRRWADIREQRAGAAGGQHSG